MLYGRDKSKSFALVFVSVLPAKKKNGSENRAGSSRDAMAGNNPFYYASALTTMSEGWTWKPHSLFPGLEDT